MKKGVLHLALLNIFLSCGQHNDLHTVNSLDLNKYQGNWYEIARLPNSFEKDLICVRAVYTLEKSGRIKVLNSGYNTVKDKEVKITGKARVPDSTKPGEIKVTFFWPFAGDYYVIDVDQSYQTALVGSPDRKYLWILCRNTTMDKNRFYELKEKGQALGFDMSGLMVVSQDCNE